MMNRITLPPNTHTSTHAHTESKLIDHFHNLCNDEGVVFIVVVSLVAGLSPGNMNRRNRGFCWIFKICGKGYKYIFFRRWKYTWLSLRSRMFVHSSDLQRLIIHLNRKIKPLRTDVVELCALRMFLVIVHDFTASANTMWNTVIPRQIYRSDKPWWKFRRKMLCNNGYLLNLNTTEHYMYKITCHICRPCDLSQYTEVICNAGDLITLECLISVLLYSISQEICTRFCCALLCCGYAIVHNEFTLSIYPHSSGLLCWHWGNR